ncbi:hypothetical protein T484DRAFT_1769691 [Baffinella frigidus]|nr:hypothetical protein T484DRAFT_1769691 [Cryptophyta sp. CCMP2293]
MENKGAGGVTDDYQFLDPNLAGPLPNDARKPFREAVVFSVGSGNYVEYQDLQDYAARTSKNIIYGTTELVTAAEFLRQLSVLGAKKFSTI